MSSGASEPVSQDRLQPALLDRLTDAQPTSRVESRDLRVISMRRLREYVLRDLAWLLNTTPLGQTQDLSEFPYARDSVIDFGMRDLAGVALSGVDPVDLERSIRDAILRFEPRIQKKTLRVHAVLPDDPQHRNSLAFEIEGDLWGQPVPTRLYLKSEIDLEDGSMTVSEGAVPGTG
jgi:type VI secretion system protein ImpF